jgi:splicing factor U2AF 65 kDa subunit
MDLAGNAIKVTHASIGYTQASGLEMGVNAMSMFAGTTTDDMGDGRVLQLLNMVTPEELIDNEDYEGPRHTLALSRSPPVHSTLLY